jgi:hypothetical protein
VLDVIADPNHPGRIYAGTDKAGIFVSDDCGATWKKANMGKNADVIDAGSNWFLALSPDEPDVLYSAALYGSDNSLLKSTDLGVDWSSTMPAGGNVATAVQYDFFQWASMDPTSSKHIVVTFHADCTDPPGKMCMGETKDGGATWRLFKGPTAAWAEQSGPTVLGPTSWLFWAVEGGVYYTGDSGATWENLGIGGASTYFVAPDGTHYLGGLYGIYTAPDGHTFTQLAGAPNVDALIGTKERLYVGVRHPSSPTQTMAWLPIDGKGTWTWLTVPADFGGTVNFAYDSDHEVLYSANQGDLWRVVTK